MADTSQGNPPPAGGQGGDAPQYVTVDDFNKTLNQAITKRFNEFTTGFDKKLEGLVTKQFEGVGPALEKVIDERLSAFKPAGDGKGTPQGGTDPSKVDLENHPLFKGMKKQLEEQSKVSAQLKDERDAEKAKARDTTLRQRVTEHLSKTIPADRLSHALGYLLDAQKRVRWADETSDEIVYKDRDGDVDLETGLASWLKGDDAKLYLPPRGPQGSGDRGGGQRPPKPANGSRKVTYEELGNELIGLTRGMPQPR